MRTNYELIENFIQNPPTEISSKFPILFKKEWEVVPGHSQFGLGDLVYTNNEKTEFLVVELQIIDRHDCGATARKRRNKLRNRVQHQARIYAEKFSILHLGIPVYHTFFTNEIKEDRVVINGPTISYKKVPLDIIF
jgi:hypothetical protein